MVPLHRQQNICLIFGIFCKIGSRMQLSQSMQMRPEMRQLLTPRMIQSMEILQLPLAAAGGTHRTGAAKQPVLEFLEGESEADQIPDVDPIDTQRADSTEDEHALVCKGKFRPIGDFERLAKLSEYLENEEFFTNGSNFRQAASYDGERDKKLEPMNNTAARASRWPST